MPDLDRAVRLAPAAALVARIRGDDLELLLAILTASWLLELAGSPSGAAMIPALFAAGVAMAVVNFGSPG